MSHDDISGDPSSPHSVYEPVAIAVKNFQIYGMKLYMDEFPYEKRTKLRESEERDSLDDEGHQFHSQMSIGYGEKLGGIQKDVQNLMPQVQILGSHGKQSIKIKIKQNDALPGPKVSKTSNIEVFALLSSCFQNLK